MEFDRPLRIRESGHSLTVRFQSTSMSDPAEAPSRKHPLRGGSYLLLAGVIAGSAIGAGEAVAQNRGGGAAPPAARGGRSAPPAAKGKPAPPKPADEPVDPLKLPADYTVPPKPPEWLTTTDEWNFEPWPSPKELNEAKSAYSKLLTTGELNSEVERKLLANMVEYKLAQMTRRDNKESVYAQRNKLVNEIKTAGGVRGKRDVRNFMLQQVADKAPKLFDYQFMARINGAILLAELSDIVEVEQVAREPAVHCIRAAKPLIDLVQQVDEKNRKQPEAVRTWLVDGLVRLALLPEVKSQTRTQIVDVLTAQLAASASDHEWLQWKLAEAVGTIGIAYDADRKPTVAQVLAEILVDTKRPIVVRAEAAQSLGKLNYGNDVDLSLIAHEIARLAEQVGRDYQTPQGARVSRQRAFAKLYLAFKSANEDEAKAGHGLLTQIGAKPPLAAHKKTVQDAFDVVLPLIQKVLSPQPTGTLDEPLTKLNDWLKANPPRRTGIADNLPPIINQSSSGTPSGQATSPTSG